MNKAFPWIRDGAGWRADMPNAVTLYAAPEHIAGPLGGRRAARGSKWRAGASQWDEATRTISRYGRDRHGDFFDNGKAAMAAAESTYQEAHRETQQL